MIRKKGSGFLEIFQIGFSRLNTLCTPLIWMRIAAVATSGYVWICYKLQCTMYTAVVEIQFLRCIQISQIRPRLVYTKRVQPEK